MKAVIAHDDIRKMVRERYADIATGTQSGCGCATPACCSPQAPATDAPSVKLGYSKKELDAVPDGADMGLGCGNPQAIAGLKKGEVVLDLGAGGGFDCFLAVKPVPKALREDFDKHSGCVSGALQFRKLESILAKVGFMDDRVAVKETSKEFIKDWFPGSGIEAYVRSADAQGTKPEKNISKE